MDDDGEPIIDDRGVVTFAVHDHQGSGGVTLFAGDGGLTTELVIVETHIFVSNSKGDVAHLGVPGILTFGPSGNHTVIGHRDPLFGSTVENLGFYRGFNNRGDVAFNYSLANGVHGIAVARVIPEPASVALAPFALAAFARRRPQHE
ncbi:MAG: hypothetical protein H0T51_23575 [Pirellulales bacterium]|nr:hypothetical protein [Pirellulales bacterium]